MGFLKFLKKREKVNLPEEELDVPPAPPSIEGEDFGLEPLGEELPEPPELPELPELPAIEEEPELEIPELPKMPSYAPEEIPKKPEIPRFKPEIFVPVEDIVKKPIFKPKVHEAHKAVKPIFIKLDDYRGVLDEIEAIKSHLNNFEEASMRLEGAKDNRDKRFARWNDVFKDIQKKLVFVDKTLFGSR